MNPKNAGAMLPIDHDGHDRAAAPPPAPPLPGARWLWTTCPACDGDVAYVASNGADTDTGIALESAPPEVVLALCGATTICPACETVLTLLVELHCSVAARPLPGGRQSYPSDAAFLRDTGWTRQPHAAGDAVRWCHPTSPFALATEAAVWQQRQWMLDDLRPTNAAEVADLRAAAVPLPPSGRSVPAVRRRHRDRRR